MKTLKLTGLLVLFSTTIFAQHQTVPQQNTIQYLKQFRSDFCRSRQDAKFEVLQHYYAEDMRLMPEFQKTVIGKHNVLLYDIAFSKRFEIKEYKRAENEILDLGARVVETGTFEMKILIRNTGEQPLIKGKYLDLWKKDSLGLTLVTQAWNYNQALSFEDKLIFDEVPVTNVALSAHLPINDAISFELAALNGLMEKVVTEHDAKIWSQFYADDGQFLYSRSPAYAGRKSLDEFMENHVKGLPVFEKLDVRNDLIDNLGNYVFEYASHIAIIRSGGFSGVFTGKDLVIWRREPNGSLKIFRHIAMYD